MLDGDLPVPEGKASLGRDAGVMPLAEGASGTPPAGR